MGKTTRWELAQNYEINWWKKREATVGGNYFYISADEVRSIYNSINKIKPETRILEVGSGAIGIINYLSESDFRFGIDPLEYYYSSVTEFVNTRDKKVKYQTAKGEKLPFENNSFDIVILDNVLDHCDDPLLVIKEIKRVAREGALIYFRLNTYNWWGKMMRNLMEYFLIDKGHPYTFLKTDINKIFADDFELIGKKRNGYFSTWILEISSKNLKDKIKALLLITRDKITYLYLKK